MSGSNADYLSYRLGYISYRFSDRISIINDGQGWGRATHYSTDSPSVAGVRPELLIGQDPSHLASDWLKCSDLCLIHHLGPTSIEGN